MKSYMTRQTSLLALMVGVMCAPAAQAQMMDYGSLQSLFGEPVTTSAIGTPQRAKDAPANMTIITADEIRQSPTRDLAAVLSKVPGINILQGGRTGYDVGMRGYNQPFQPRMLILVNGRQVYIDDYSRTVWDNIPVNIDDIRQIEVVKGPNAALFGVNAVGGVVNIVTNNPLYDNVNVAAVSAGTQDAIRGDATATVHLGEWGGIKLSVGGYNEGEFTTERSAADEAQKKDPKKRYVAADSLFQIKPNMQVGFEATASSTDTTLASPLNSTGGNRTNTASLKGSWLWQTDYGLWKLTSYWNHSRTDGTPSSLFTKLGYSDDMISTQLENQFKIGANHTFRLSGEFRRNMFNIDTSQARDQSPTTVYNVWSGGGMWNWKISDTFNMTTAARLDHLALAQTGSLWPYAIYPASAYDQTRTDYSVNVGLVYQPTPDDTLRFTFGRGIQMPSSIEMGFSFVAPVGGGTIINVAGNPYIKQTVVQNYELGYDRNLAQINSVLRASVFYQTNDNMKGIANGQTFTSTPPGVVTINAIGSANIGNSQGWGTELQLKGQSASGFRWDASYSFARVADEQTISAVLKNDGSAPRHTFRLAGGYTYKKWEFDAQGSYVTDLNMLYNSTGVLGSSTTTHIDGYATLGGRIGYKINDNFTVAVSATNLQAAETKASAFPKVQRQAFLTVTGKF
jgi:outer membrane receptor for ferrienterochelin and colicins